MDTNEPTQISSLSEFIEWVNQLGSTNYLLQGECLFRGVSDQSYEINASAYRRLGGKNNDLNKFHRLTEGRQPWQNRLKTLDICRCDQGLRNCGLNKRMHFKNYRIVGLPFYQEKNQNEFRETLDEVLQL